MAAVLGDLIQCVDNQSYLGQQVLNVYYYRIVATLGLADPYLPLLNDSFEDNVLDNVVGIQVDDLVHLSREWRNMTNGTDLFVDSTAVPGTVATAGGELLPSFVSAGFLLQRESLVTRNGYKRFAGLSEANIAGNNWVTSTAPLDAIAAGLAADLVDGVALLAEPVIVKRPIAVPVTTYDYSSIGSATFRSIGTQNTRKAGRGV